MNRGGDYGYRETHARSLAKTISWRLVATAITFGLAYLWLGNVAESAGLAVLANGVKGVMYYGHERVWNALRWGRTAPGARPETARNDRSSEALEIKGGSPTAVGATDLVNETCR